MSRTLGGLIPASLTPFDDEGKIHDGDLEGHLQYLTGVAGVTGVTVNGHAGEVSSLDRDEQRHVLRVARKCVAEDQHLIAGVYAHSTKEAAEVASLAVDEGADCLLVFPPEVWEFGVAEDSRLAIGYYAAIARAADLPIIAFVYPTTSPLHLAPSVILDLCREVPSITAVKDWSNDMVVFETILRGLRAEHPDVSMLSSYSRSLLGTLTLGADGILSGHASLIPEAQAALLAAVAACDTDEVERVSADLFTLTTTFYAPPISDGFTRMKYASRRLGRIGSDVVREPLPPLTDRARAEIDAVLPLLCRYASDQGGA